jgi:hypothetical protein
MSRHTALRRGRSDHAPAARLGAFDPMFDTVRPAAHVPAGASVLAEAPQ